MDPDAVKRRMAALPDDELIEVVTAQRATYRPEAIEIAEAELTSRGLGRPRSPQSRRPRESTGSTDAMSGYGGTRVGTALFVGGVWIFVAGAIGWFGLDLADRGGFLTAIGWAVALPSFVFVGLAARHVLQVVSGTIRARRLMETDPEAFARLKERYDAALRPEDTDPTTKTRVEGAKPEHRSGEIVERAESVRSRETLWGVPIEDEHGGGGESVDIERVEEGRYRLLCTPITIGDEDPPLQYGDVVELEPLAGTGFRYLRRVRIGRYRHLSRGAPPGLTNSPAFRRFSRKLHDAGGEWEVLFGGILWVHVPDDAETELDGMLDALLADVSNDVDGTSDGSR